MILRKKRKVSVSLDMEFVKSIEEFIDRLRTTAPENFPDLWLLRSFPISVLTDFQYFDPNKYTRISIHREESFELVLLCWNPGNSTPVHAHDGQKCWVVPLEGALKEKYFVLDHEGSLKSKHTRLLEFGGLSYMDDAMGYHSLENESNGKAISLHVYMNPLNHCRFYCQLEERFKEKPLEYDTVIEKVIR